jgi:hypothetical protein
MGLRALDEEASFIYLQGQHTSVMSMLVIGASGRCEEMVGPKMTSDIDEMRSRSTLFMHASCF